MPDSGVTSLGRTVVFRAAHHYRLAQLSETENRRRFGAVAESHWHHWRLTVWLQGEVDSETGMMLDLEALDRVLHECVEPYRDRDFAQVDPTFCDRPPTTERLAQYFFERLEKRVPATLTRVRIAEDDHLFAEYAR